MRNVFIITYDIGDPKRLRLIYRFMRGWGDHLQLSVFRCELSSRELVELRTDASALINHAEDQILFVDVGPVEGRGSEAIRSVGKVYAPPERCAIVV